MGRLTVDIPDGVHHQLKIMAIRRGQTIKDFLLSQILPTVEHATGNERLRKDMENWEATRENLRLERGERSWHDISHEGHKW